MFRVRDACKVRATDAQRKHYRHNVEANGDQSLDKRFPISGPRLWVITDIVQLTESIQRNQTDCTFG